MSSGMGNLHCYIKVEQCTVVMKERNGKFNEVLEPGCHCVPWFIGYKVAGQISLHLQQLDVRSETKTKDNVLVHVVVASIQYRALAEKTRDAFYRLSDTKSQIQTCVSNAVEEELEKAMSTHGFEIVRMLIVDIEPDANVKLAMNINAAARLRMAANEKAEAEQIKRAEGEAEFF